MKKSVAICVVGILVGTAYGASAFTTQDKPYNDLGKGSPLVLILGSVGNNSWYISDVRISFQYDPSDVVEIWFRLKIGEDWKKYTGEFTVTSEGSHIIPWYWIDKNNTIHDEIPIEFGIDQISPSVELTKQKLSRTEVKFTATTNDVASGVDKVEFYCDDILQTTDTASPYEWIWTGTENQQVKAIAYDKAGHLQESNTLPTPVTYMPHAFMFLRLLLQRLLLHL
jgi:hypothetical protein